ncbi:hypothetical protein FACS18949_10670 [Clostridia bacterium]|nr:hypothetical protein FACS18949_10670 [Clostridia bacterium]
MLNRSLRKRVLAVVLVALLIAVSLPSGVSAATETPGIKLEYTITGLPHDYTIQNFHIANKYVYVTQSARLDESGNYKKGEPQNDVILTRLEKDDTAKTAKYLDEMTLLDCGHGQTLDSYADGWFWVSSHADQGWSIEVARLEYVADKKYVKKNGNYVATKLKDKKGIVISPQEYTQLTRFSHMDSANKDGKKLGTIKRVDAGGNSKRTIFMIGYTSGNVVYSIYDTEKLDKLLTKVGKGKHLDMSSKDAKDACINTSPMATKATWPNESFQGIDMLGDGEIYISGGNAAELSVPKISRIDKDGKVIGDPKSLYSTSFPGGRALQEIEGVQTKKDLKTNEERVYFCIVDPNNKKGGQKIFSVPASAFATTSAPIPALVPTPTQIPPTPAQLHDGDYNIVSQLGSGKVLDVSGASWENGAGLILYQPTGGSNQVFSFRRQLDGSYIITPKHSGLPIEVSNSSKEIEGRIQQWALADGYPCKRWFLVADGSAWKIVNANSNLCMDVSGAVDQNGQPIWQYTDNGTLAQRFRMEPVN